MLLTHVDIFFHGHISNTHLHILCTVQEWPQSGAEHIVWHSESPLFLKRMI